MSGSLQRPPRPPQFPPLAWLGYGLNLTKVQPFDFKSVAAAKTDVRIVDITKDTTTRTITIGGVDYEVPRVVIASEENRSQSLDKIYANGALAVQDLKNDANVAFRLLPVTTSDISFFPLANDLPNNNQFYFFVNDFDAYTSALRGYLEFINEEELLKYVSQLSPFDPDDPDVIQSYVEFFNVVGTHYISNTSSGARFELEVWASNKHAEVNANFKRDVTASIEGLNDGGEYDNTVFSEPQYRVFDRLSQRIVRVQGGSPGLVDALTESPTSTTFREWVDSVSGNPVLVSVKALELWTLLRDANDGTLRQRARDIQAAFEYITSLPTPKYDRLTWVTFEADASLAEFGILNPSVVIGGADSAEESNVQVIGPAKLRFGSRVHPRQRYTALFVIIENGTPIDIYVSASAGWAKVAILRQEYRVADGIKWFYEVPVALEAQT